MSPEGIFGEIQRGLADVAWADIFLIPDRAVAADFSEMYFEDSACFLVHFRLLVLHKLKGFADCSLF